MKIGWTERASLDLDRIVDFRRGEEPDIVSEASANLLHQRILAAADGLANFPLIGRPVGAYRRVVVAECVVVYEILRAAGTIAILRVRHGKELPYGIEAED